ncbi:MAG: F0F1 ATP synthase subunit gamma [Clostridiales bacterium]|nr:F0F1 ATP synthase subunit gamma [Clostridiales bacterium]
MGAAGLIEIKRRLKSVQSTKKITKAMGFVATSKLRKSRKELSANNAYAEIAKKNVKIAAEFVDDSSQFLYFKKNNSQKVLYIVVTSDSGLCGGYNINVVNKLKQLAGLEKDNVCVITVGAKGIPYIKKTGFNSVAEYVDIPDVPTIKEVKFIYEKALRLFCEGEVSEVKIIYTEFHSPVKQVVKSETLLPIEIENSNVGSQGFVEPDVNIVLKKSLDIYLKGMIRSILLSSKCSEQSARMTAMDSATSNANDIISSLEIKYNRIRQTMITQEISEIVGGAEAQK